MKRLFLACALLFGAISLSSSTPITIGGAFIIPAPTQAWAPNYDLNELQWNVWDSATLTNGAVSSWVTAPASDLAITLTQPTGAAQPTMDNTALGGIGAVGFATGDSLLVPIISDPWRYYRAMVVVLQANITGASSSSGLFVGIAGFSGSVGNREPYFGYIKGTPNQITVQWGNGSNSCTVSAPWPDDTNPHVVVSRRYQGIVYLSVDSSTEVFSGSGNCNMPRQANTGQVGDFRSPGISWNLNYLSFLQDDLTADAAQRTAAYFMWHIGKQAAIPGGNPWAATPPTSKPFVNPYLYNTFNEVDSVLNPCFHVNINTCLKAQYGNSMAPYIANATNLIWNQTFSNINMLCGEAAAATGTCVMFGPTLDGTCGNGTPSPVCVDPSVNTATVFTQTGSEIDINMQQIGGTGAFFSGQITSINIEGQGFTVDPRLGPVYIESKVKLVSNNNHCMWSAPLWIEPWLRFRNGTTPYGEIDTPETYAGESSGQNNHYTVFQHDPPIHYPGRTVLSSQNGQDFSLDVPHGFPGAPISTYDGAFHLYQLYIDKTQTCTGMDGSILGCHPTLRFMLNPQMLIVSLYANPGTDAPCSGTYVLGLNTLKVYQGTY